MEKITYKKSFASKLILSQESIPYYQAIKDLCATRKKVNTRLSFNKETITFGRNKVAAMKISRKNISLYLALDPKKYEGTKYRFKDISETTVGQDYPMVVQVKSNRGLKYALELLDEALNNVSATTICQALDVNYAEIYYPRSFEQLVAEGLIKKYVKVAGKEVLVETPVEMCNVNFTAKLLYEATNQAEDLFIITSYSNWDLQQAVKMHKNADSSFTASMTFPKNTLLEFKICRSQNWNDVEKGIWKEEIVNHNYVIVDKDLEVEDLIYNFRKN